MNVNFKKRLNLFIEENKTGNEDYRCEYCGCIYQVPVISLKGVGFISFKCPSCDKNNTINVEEFAKSIIE